MDQNAFSVEQTIRLSGMKFCTNRHIKIILKVTYEDFYPRSKFLEIRIVMQIKGNLIVFEITCM